MTWSRWSVDLSLNFEVEKIICIFPLFFFISAWCVCKNPIGRLKWKYQSAGRFWWMFKCEGTEQRVHRQILLDLRPNNRARLFTQVRKNSQTAAVARCICERLRWRKLYNTQHFFFFVVFKSNYGQVQNVYFYLKF